jgi:uncharacterized protein (TIGR02246 family)
MTTTSSANALDESNDAALDVIRSGYDAWAANDAALMASLYLEDATVVQPGIHKKNNDDIRTSMAALFAGPLKGSRVLDTPLSVRYPGEDVAVVITEGGVVMAGQTEFHPAQRVRATWVVAKRDGRWYIAAYHNSPAD